MSTQSALQLRVVEKEWVRIPMILTFFCDDEGAVRNRRAISAF